MQKSKTLRWSLNGSAAVLALVGALAPAQAYETKFGDVSIVFDTTVSMGGSLRTGDRNMDLVAPSNGGPVDLRDGDPGSVALPAITGLTVVGATALCGVACGSPTGNFTTTNNPYAYGGSINSDDARLNYDSGDFIGAPLKATSDMVVKWENYTVFLRGIAYYDVVLNDHDVGDRSLITDKAIGEVGRNAKLLDAFISANYVIADLPVNLRVGKQVINWGESTFILNGLNNFNPIDVGAFRRPGSEIKEALLPLNAIYGSVTLPEELLNISLAGYYALAWDRYHLDQAGTPFAGSDVATFGSGLGGNEGAASFLSGGLRAGYKLNCGVGLAQTPGGLTTARFLSLIPGTSGTYFTQIAGTNDSPGVTRPNCTQGATNTFNYATNNAFGAAEFERFRRRDVIIADGLAASASAYEGIVDRVDDVYADETGDFGLNAKYLHEGEGWLNGFEFGAYYQNYSSRLPFVDLTTGQFQVGVGTVGNSANIAGEVNSATVASSLASRYAGPAGCTNPLFGNSGTSFGVLAADPRYAALDGFAISDPQNLLNPNTIVQASGFLGTGATSKIIDRSNGQTLGYDLTHDAAGNVVAPGSADAIITDFGTAGFYHRGTGAAALGQFNNMRNMVEVNCALSLLQATLVAGGTLPVLMNGSMVLTANNQYGLSLRYPEGIEQFGLSWAGTIGTWGVQGEFTYRPNAPFQEDTDEMTISAATDQCAFVAAGLVGSLLYENLNTGGVHHCNPLDVGNSRIDGVIENDMYTAQIGTTATFTGSEWFIEAIGADIGILVPEIGLVYVPDVEDTWVDNNPLVGVAPGNPGAYIGPRQYQNTGCQGSDLPLGALLELDAKSSKKCRPNDWSAGLVVLANVSYNNAFDTGFVVTPQIAVSYDFTGTTPAPYGNYVEDRIAVNLGVSGTLNNNFRIGVNYVNYFGAGVRNKAQDQDYVSASASYSF